MIKCKECGAYFKRKHASEKYCSITCRDKSRMKQNRLKSNRYYAKHKHELSEKKKYTLGTGFLGEHRKVNFMDESETVRKELTRLHLKPKIK